MRETILIADDDPELREILRLTLERAGYVTAEAANGNDALTVLRSIPVDLLITDIAMPERDGFEMLRALRNDEAAPKIIAMSGALEGICLPMAARLGAQAVLPKPWDNQQLLEIVRGVLNGCGERETAPVVNAT